jgi:hypothetical protein
VYLQVWDCSLTFETLLNCPTHNIPLILLGGSVPLVFIIAGLSEESSVTILTYYGVLFRVLTFTIGLKTRQTLSGTLMLVPNGIRLLAGVAVVVLT